MSAFTTLVCDNPTCTASLALPRTAANRLEHPAVVRLIARHGWHVHPSSATRPATVTCKRCNW